MNKFEFIAAFASGLFAMSGMADAQTYEAKSGQLQELTILGTVDESHCAGFRTGKIEFSQPANGALTTQEGNSSTRVADARARNPS